MCVSVLLAIRNQPRNILHRYMIVKNYDITRGIVNGTLCELLTYDRSVLQVKLLTGAQAGKVVMLPRCTFEVSAEDSGLPFAFKRTQFPLMPGYCATVHKAQGQSLKRVGVDLTEQVFAHGQLYVALSRASTPDGLFILSGQQKSKNVVYREVVNFLDERN